MKTCGVCGAGFEAEGWRCPVCGQQPGVIGGFPALAPEVALDGEGFQSAYFPELAKLEERHFWFRARNELILWAMQRKVPRFDRFLEIGCGTGYVISAIARRYPEAHFTGSELLSGGLPFAAQRIPAAELVQMDARQPPFSDHFDVVGAFDVLEHIDDDRGVLRSINRTLKPGGHLLLTVPQHPWLWSYLDEYACHVRRYTASDLRDKLREAGFNISLETSFVSLLLPALWLSRKLYAIDSNRREDPLLELRIGRVANAVLEGVMTLERAAIYAGLRVPAGGSLLIVAQRT